LRYKPKIPERLLLAGAADMLPAKRTSFPHVSCSSALLRAILSERPAVLLIDEIDR
jgi:hypothetical protein